MCTEVKEILPLKQNSGTGDHRKRLMRGSEKEMRWDEMCRCDAGSQALLISTNCFTDFRLPLATLHVVAVEPRALGSCAQIHQKRTLNGMTKELWSIPENPRMVVTVGFQSDCQIRHAWSKRRRGNEIFWLRFLSGALNSVFLVPRKRGHTFNW